MVRFRLQRLKIETHIQIIKIAGVLCFVLVYATPGFLVTGAYTLMGRRLWAIRPPFDDQQGMISVQQVE